MARAIKHIKAGLLHVEVIGTIPEREPGRGGGGPLPSHLRRPAVLQQQMLLAGAGAEAGGQFRRAGLGAHPHL